jgi:hypothetical protein
MKFAKISRQTRRAPYGRALAVKLALILGMRPRRSGLARCGGE